MSQARFNRFGRSYHLDIKDAAGLRVAASLDEALWVSSNAPVASINADPVLLGLLDADSSGRITCAELRAAIGWMLEALGDTTALDAASDVLSLKAVNESNQSGQQLAAAMRNVLAHLGEDGDTLSLSQVRHIKARLESGSVSETGVVLPSAAEDDRTREFIVDVVAATGGAPSPAGGAGATTGLVNRFLAESRSYLAWLDAGEGKAVLGAATPAAAGLVASLRDKLDQYFAQCDAAAYDPRLAEHVRPAVEALNTLVAADAAQVNEFLRQSPLAMPRPEGRMRLDSPVNPYYADALQRLRSDIAEPLLGEPCPTLDKHQWRRINALLAPFEAWQASRPQTNVDSLGSDKLRLYLEPRYAQAVGKLASRCTRAAVAMGSLWMVEKAILFQTHLLEFANNFVSFPRLYSRDQRAAFEMGTLIMDGRRFNFAVRVVNRAAHASVAASSGMCILYVEVTPPDAGSKYEVAVPVTSGGRGNLVVGKRGIFQDIAGNECDAVVVHVIDSPISLAEALASPFRRIGRVLTGKIESLTSEAEKKLDAATAAAVAAAPPAAPAPVQPRPPAPVGGLLLGGGVAIAALGSALAYITKTLSQTLTDPAGQLAIAIGVLAAVLAVVVPTAIVAWLKLRRRDLSALLEGSGWGINARMRLSRPQARFFTKRPPYPDKALGIRRPGRWLLRVLLIIVVAAVIALLLWAAYQAAVRPST